TDEQFLAQVVAQQTGVAVSNAQMHAGERRTARELAAANAALEEKVAALRLGMQVHERLTKIAVTGAGTAGIAQTLHELTGLPGGRGGGGGGGGAGRRAGGGGGGGAGGSRTRNRPPTTGNGCSAGSWSRARRCATATAWSRSPRPAPACWGCWP